MPHNSKGRTRRKPIDLNMARLFSTRQNRAQPAQSCAFRRPKPETKSRKIAKSVTRPQAEPGVRFLRRTAPGPAARNNKPKNRRLCHCTHGVRFFSQPRNAPSASAVPLFVCIRVYSCAFVAKCFLCYGLACGGVVGMAEGARFTVPLCASSKLML